ncbi:CPBP family intramembrane glutamic endopeptidase [Iodidimonas sp. SYSU 1G8]|uniref:CPBP family intramembrane glutamic endopeptidase n=1 Tax=Iodidimonas sp. SYSU 1G8 TaxID=3133967 RepID=UPI0031FECC33
MNAAPPEAAPPVPYGPWATLGLTVVIFIGAGMIASGLVGVVTGRGVQDSVAGGDTNAMLTAMILSGIIGTAMTAELVHLRAPGRVADYLALRWTDNGTAWRWSLLTVGYLFLALLVDNMARVSFDVVSPHNPLANAAIGPLFLLATLFVAPVFEEVLFRGFVMEGLSPTLLGQSGAITIAALSWALLHSQYDVITMLLLFGFGVLLGVARVVTGSLLLPIVLHAVFNTASITLSGL